MNTTNTKTITCIKFHIPYIQIYSFLMKYLFNICFKKKYFLYKFVRFGNYFMVQTLGQFYH